MKAAAIITAGAATTLLIVVTILGIATLILTRPPHQPGEGWQHDHGSVYWSCTSDGHALLKDASTGAITLDRDDRHCDAGG